MGWSDTADRGSSLCDVLWAARISFPTEEASRKSKQLTLDRRIRSLDPKGFPDPEEPNRTIITVHIAADDREGARRAIFDAAQKFGGGDGRIESLEKM